MTKTRTRNTAQRRVIQDVMAQAHAPLNPLEILDISQKTMPKIGIATVYREIKRLLEDGLIQAVEVPGDITRYERTGLAHHHHFKCETCQRVYDLEGCIGNVQHLLLRGFTHRTHEIVIYGQCAGCQPVGR